MLKLDRSLSAWGTSDFEIILKQEIERLGIDQLPLQQGLASGNYVTAEPVTVVINSVAEMEDVIRVHAGIFYQSVTSGCSCDGDPTPTSENTEYCEVRLDIDKVSAATVVTLVA